MRVKPGARGGLSLLLTPLEWIRHLASLIPLRRQQTAAPQEAAIRLSRAQMAFVGRIEPVNGSIASGQSEQSRPRRNGIITQ
jgi:hypothetical protein